MEPPSISIRVADAGDASEVAALRALWMTGQAADAEFRQRVASWLLAERERRTVWLAKVEDETVGMVSVVEYRRMPKPGLPDSAWGYIGQMFVRDQWRNAGIGSALLAELIATAEDRRYARLVVSPSTQSLSFWRRAGFATPGEAPDDQGLMVRRGA